MKSLIWALPPDQIFIFGIVLGHIATLAVCFVLFRRDCRGAA